MQCLRCKNEDPRLFGMDQGSYYCRKCMDFGRLPVGCMPPAPRLHQRVWLGKPKLQFALTEQQKRASDAVVQHLKDGKDTFLFAACGSGKTEIVYDAIAWYLSRGLKVCFAISRRQVVLEIAKRLQSAFCDLDVIAVCQGHTRRTDADLIVCTTHQLFRYPGCFDLLIMDEMDAFPFAGNDVLEKIALQACRGQRLLLSATPDPAVMEQVARKEMEMVELFMRPHGKPLCVPAVVRTTPALSVLHILHQCHLFHSKEQQVLLFVPRKKDAIWMQKLLSCFWKTAYVHADVAGKDAVMEAFRARKTEILVCTTLLERGITVPSVQVLVYRADHIVFTQASLIQIFGRVGRSFQDPTGTGIAYCMDLSDGLRGCIEQLKWMNQRAFGAEHPYEKPTG